MKHYIAMMAIVGLVLGSGCGGGNSPGDESTGRHGSLPRAEAFRVAVPDFAPFRDTIRQEWQDSSKATGSGLQLEVVTLDYRALHQELFAGGGLAEGRFDAVLLHGDWLAEANRDNLLEDLAPRIRKSPPEDYPAAWAGDLLAMQKFDARVLGLPYHDGMLCMLYRSDMFAEDLPKRAYVAKYGRDMAPPETWDDLGRLAAFLNRPEYEMYGTALPARPNGPGPFWLLAAGAWSRGGDLLGEKGLQLDTPEVEASLESYRRIVGDRYAVHRAVREMDVFDIGRSFAKGGLVMAVAPVGFAAMAEVGARSTARGHVAVGPLPHEAEGTPLALSSYWVLAVPKSSPNRDLAYRFAKHCADKPADKARTLAGVLGTRKSTWADEEVRKAMPFVTELESLHGQTRTLPQRADLSKLAAEVDRAVIKAIEKQEK